MIEFMSPVRSRFATAAIRWYFKAKHFSLVKTYHKDSKRQHCDQDTDCSFWKPG
jgi:hypothetical protein